MHERKVVIYLACMHLICLATTTYVHSIPVHIGNFLFQWDFLIMPIVFTSSLYATWRYGTNVMRSVIRLVAPGAFVLAYVMNLIFDTGMYVGIEKLFTFDMFVAQIAIASTCAYVAGQSMTMWTYVFMRKYDLTVLALIAAMVSGSFYDSLLFFTVFTAGGEFANYYWINLTAFSTVCKSIVHVIFFVPILCVLKRITLHSIPVLNKINLL